MSDAGRLQIDDAAWDAWVAATPPAFHLQQSAWAEVKAANGWRAERIVVDAGSGPAGLQLLVRRLGPGPFSVGYAPRGPVMTRWDAASVAALTAALRTRARALRLTHVTIDPGESDPAIDTLLRAAGWRGADLVQHDRSRIVPLGDGEAAVWGGLRSKWRQYVGKAERAGVVVTEGGRDDLGTFHAILSETAQRTGFFARDAGAYRATWDAFARRGAARLLIARLPGGEPVAALFLVRCGGRMAEPYGGMTEAGAASRANYLLKWESIRRAIAEGADRYDMWGIAHPGIEQFKEGFGGSELRYVGAYDLVTLPLARDLLVAGRRAWVALVRRRLARERGHGGTAGPATPEPGSAEGTG